MFEVKKFLESQDSYSLYINEFNSFEQLQFLWDCIDCWYKKLDRSNLYEGYLLLQKYSGNKSIIDAIGNHYFENTTDFLFCCIMPHKIAALFIIGLLDIQKWTVYYHLVSIKYLTQKGMKIYLITDEDAQKKSNTYMETAIVPYLCFNKC